MEVFVTAGILTKFTLLFVLNKDVHCKYMLYELPIKKLLVHQQKFNTFSLYAHPIRMTMRTHHCFSVQDIYTNIEYEFDRLLTFIEMWKCINKLHMCMHRHVFELQFMQTANDQLSSNPTYPYNVSYNSEFQKWFVWIRVSGWLLLLYLSHTFW